MNSSAIIAALCAFLLGFGMGEAFVNERTRTVTRTVRPALRYSKHNEVVPSKPGFTEHAVYRSSGCGVERWAVKTLTDPGASQVTLAVQGSSVADLTSIAPPESPTDRVNPTEETVFQVQGTVTFAKPESDGDYHLVVDDGAGHTMIVESPNPSCATGSLVIGQIEQVRQQLNLQFPGLARGETLRPNEAVTVDGVGFFDRLHGQTGVAPNGIELHPILHLALAPARGADTTKLQQLTTHRNTD